VGANTHPRHLPSLLVVNHLGPNHLPQPQANIEYEILGSMTSAGFNLFPRAGVVVRLFDQIIINQSNRFSWEWIWKDRHVIEIEPNATDYGSPTAYASDRR